MKVLIAVQDAEFGEAITDMVLGHAWPEDSEFKLLTVWEYPGYSEMMELAYGGEATESRLTQHDNAAENLLDEYRHKLQTAFPGARVTKETVYGIPHQAIIEQAESWGADLIVMGSHARKGLSKFLLGSVSMSVLSQAPCSVMVVKLPKLQKGTKTCVHGKQAVTAK